MSRREADRFEDLPILAELRERLAGHMRDASGPARRRPSVRWAMAGVRTVPVLLAVTVTVAVVLTGLIVMRHGHAPASLGGPNPAGHLTRPSPGQPNPSPSPASGYVNRAQQQTIARDHACSQPTNRGQTIDHGSPGHAVLSVLGVLRRPPLPPDHTSKVLYKIGWDAGAGVYVNYIRRARTEYGRSYWIVPEARTTPFGPIPARCYGEFRASLVRDLRHVSPVLRAQALHEQQEQQSVQRHDSENRAGLCFIAIGGHIAPRPGAVGFGCSPGTAGTIPLAGGDGSGDRAGGTIMSGIAADGIVGVTLRYAASGRYPARTITSDVVNNVYVLKVPPRTAHQPFPTQVLLRMADGRVVPASSLMPHGSGIQTLSG